MIKITCNNLEPMGKKIKIQNEDGTDIKGVRSIDIRFRLDAIVTAILDIEVTETNIQAEPLLSYDTVKEAAEHYGYELVVKRTNPDKDIEPPEIDYVFGA
jgi:hypothetical protein